MFTGIVQEIGYVRRSQLEAGILHLDVEFQNVAGLQMGASVAINGLCLTVTGVREQTVSFDLIRETRELSNLGALSEGDRVNVERSFKVGDEVGGHILSGHIGGTVEVCDIQRSEGHCRVYVRVPSEWLPFVMDKGFVALNGASLTIASLDRAAETFSISLIPETLARTTFDAAAVGDRLNLEIDSRTQAVVETVHQVLQDPDMRKSLGLG